MKIRFIQSRRLKMLPNCVAPPGGVKEPVGGMVKEPCGGKFCRAMEPCGGKFCGEMED
jgi:hypothetical protein